jgi:hypothetical protein
MIDHGSMTEGREDKKFQMADYPFRTIASLSCNRKHHFSERRGDS